MTGVEFEYKNGFTWPYLIRGFILTKLVGKKYLVPDYGLAGRIFSIAVSSILNEAKNKNKQEQIKDIVKTYGRSRGEYVKNNVLKKKKSLSLRNMLIYTDLNPKNFKTKVSINKGDFEIKISKCQFYDCSCSSGYMDDVKYYCMKEDSAFKSAYNDSITIEVEPKYKTEKDYCIVRYKVKGLIKE